MSGLQPALSATMVPGLRSPALNEGTFVHLGSESRSVTALFSDEALNSAGHTADGRVSADMRPNVASHVATESQAGTRTITRHDQSSRHLLPAWTQLSLRLRREACARRESADHPGSRGRSDLGPNDTLVSGQRFVELVNGIERRPKHRQQMAYSSLVDSSGLDQIDAAKQSLSQLPVITLVAVTGSGQDPHFLRRIVAHSVHPPRETQKTESNSGSRSELAFRQII
jgi:hypothetical protein